MTMGISLVSDVPPYTGSSCITCDPGHVTIKLCFLQDNYTYRYRYIYFEGEGSYFGTLIMGQSADHWVSG